MQESVELVREWIEEVWNRGKLELLDKFHPALLRNNGDLISTGDTKNWHHRLRTAFPGIHYTIEDILESSDRVVIRWKATGIHRGPLWGFIPPTDKQVEWQGMHIVRVEDGLITEVWSVADQLPMLQDIGVRLLPPDGE